MVNRQGYNNNRQGYSNTKQTKKTNRPISEAPPSALEVHSQVHFTSCLKSFDLDENDVIKFCFLNFIFSLQKFSVIDSSW